MISLVERKLVFEISDQDVSTPKEIVHNLSEFLYLFMKKATIAPKLINVILF